MRVLYVTPQAPGLMSGGEISVYNFAYVLTHMDITVDYVGPYLKSEGLSSWFCKKIYIDKNITLRNKLWSVLHLQFDRKFYQWNSLAIDFNKYDIVILEFTKMEYVIASLKRNNFKGTIIARPHNVEKDYSLVALKSKPTFSKLAEYLFTAYKESYIIENSDVILVYSNEDEDRFVNLYNTPRNKFFLCPPSVQSGCENIEFKFKLGEKLKCLITGSLWFGPNCEAAKWFIENVYKNVRDICELTIAGHKPNDDIKNICYQYGIRLVESPDSMEPYFKEADMMLVPIFSGAGMKIKIAEAMSYGLPVITTSHGAIGYNFHSEENSYIADSAEDFINCIRSYYNLSADSRQIFLEKSWETYKENYSLEALAGRCDRLINTAGMPLNKK